MAKVEFLSRPSLEQRERHCDAVEQHQLDWFAHRQHGNKLIVGIGDMASMSESYIRYSPATAARKFNHTVPIDPGIIGAEVARKCLLEAPERCTPAAIMHRTRAALLLHCRRTDQRFSGCESPRYVREALKSAPRTSPIGSMGVLAIECLEKEVRLQMRTLGDTFGTIMMSGHERFNGSVLLGSESKIDQLKAKLKAEAHCRWPDVDEQYFYLLIYRGIEEKKLAPGKPEDFANIVKSHLRDFAAKSTWQIPYAMFDEMMGEGGMNRWQVNAQNQPKHPLGFTVIDATSRLQFRELPGISASFPANTISPKKPLVVSMWTDGLQPVNGSVTSIDHLRPSNPRHGEQTAVIVTITDTRPSYDICTTPRA